MKHQKPLPSRTAFAISAGVPAAISEASHEWGEADPPFVVPEFAALGCDKMQPASMGRHFLVLGETGSGKTRSAILPVTKSVARYGIGTSLEAAALIIDPKCELYQVIREQSGLLQERIVLFDVREPAGTIHFFEGDSVASLDSPEVIAA